MFYPILFSIAGFLSGGVLYSYHVPKLLCGVDVVADSPDHNPGMTNAMKLCGVPVGLLCLALDMAKGFLPVFAALRFLRIEDPWLAPVLAAPALGHALAVFYPFAGGKAVAVSFGVLLGLLPQQEEVSAYAHRHHAQRQNGVEASAAQQGLDLIGHVSYLPRFWVWGKYGQDFQELYKKRPLSSGLFSLVWMALT